MIEDMKHLSNILNELLLWRELLPTVKNEYAKNNYKKHIENLENEAKNITRVTLKMLI